MTTPWEHELAANKRADEEETHVMVPISATASYELVKLPRRVLLLAIPTVLCVSVLLSLMYSTLEASLGLDLDHSRRAPAGPVHPIQALLIFVPFFMFLSALFVRYLVMQETATEMSRKVARKIKCSAEFEKSLFKFFVRAPWSKCSYRFYWHNSPIMPFHRVRTEFGETRDIEFSDDMSFLVVHPLEWVDVPPSSIEMGIRRAIRENL